MSNDPERVVTEAGSAGVESTTPSVLPTLIQNSLRNVRAKIAPQTLADHHIVEIADLARGHLSASAEYPEGHYAGLPVNVGRVLLYPLSIGGQLWLRDHAMPAIGDDDLLSDLAVAFALAHDAEELQDLCEPKSILRRIRAWCFRAGCTREELIDATVKQLPIAKGNGEDDGTDLGSVIAVLQARRGQTFDYWIWAPFAVIEAALESIRAENDAEAASAGKHVARAPDPNSPEVQSLAALTARMKEIASEYDA